jgi:hypothetical protein
MLCPLQASVKTGARGPGLIGGSHVNWGLDLPPIDVQSIFESFFFSAGGWTDEALREMLKENPPGDPEWTENYTG